MWIRIRIRSMRIHITDCNVTTVCPGSSDTFYIVQLLYKMGHYFWTYCNKTTVEKKWFEMLTKPASGFYTNTRTQNNAHWYERLKLTKSFLCWCSDTFRQRWSYPEPAVGSRARRLRTGPGSRLRLPLRGDEGGPGHHSLWSSPARGPAHHGGKGKVLIFFAIRVGMEKLGGRRG